MRRIRSVCCARDEWPPRRRAAEQRDERAAFHSIISLAMAEMPGGTSFGRSN
jgi:hypothetical protein